MFDLCIKNGKIADGSGEQLKESAVYITGERIALISDDQDLPAKEIVDAKGHIVSPGFIDMHTHSDDAPWENPGFEGRLHQGVTTDIAGNCGTSLVPKRKQDNGKIHCLSMTEMKEELGELHIGANFNTFIGHGTLRNFCMSDPYAGTPSDEELESMKKVLRRELQAGAVGMSIGLEYMPGACCGTEELIELAKVVKEYDGVITVHMRNEDAGVFEAMEEVHRIARESGAHLHISHLKVARRPQWGKAQAALDALDAMQEDSVVTADQYPFDAFSTGLKALLPLWARKGTQEEITARFDDEQEWPKIREYVIEYLKLIGGPDKVFAANSHNVWPEIDGKNLEELGQMFGLEPADAYRKVMKRCSSNISGVTFAMDKDDVLTILRRQDIALISDSRCLDFVTAAQSGKPHPRGTSSAARFLRLVREEQLMPIEKAVAKLTSLPAGIAGLKDRGLLKEGYYADVVIFDPQTAAERADYLNPFRTCVGIDRVYVNGRLAWADGRPAGKAGRFAQSGFEKD